MCFTKVARILFLFNPSPVMDIHIDHPTLRLGDKHLTINAAIGIAPGAPVCLTGESGCGKTSLLRAVLGFVEVESGTLEVDGSPVTAGNVAAIRRVAAYVPQEINPPIEWVRDMALLPYSLSASSQARLDEDSLFRIWEDLGLDKSLYTQRVGELSGGQRARVALASALSLGKKLILADEPTAALDADSSERVAGTLSRHCSERNCTMIVASHDPVMVRHALECRLN